MTDNRRIILRSIMNNAWRTFRATGGEFAKHLRAAWKKEKQAVAYAKRFMAKAMANGGRVQFNDLTRSPIRRSLTGQRWGRQRDFQAAYTTATFGQ